MAKQYLDSTGLAYFWNKIKSYINSILPTKTSDLDNDDGFISSYTETDPIFTESAAYNITAANITNWNSKTDNEGTVYRIIAGTGISIGSDANGQITTAGTINHTNSVTAQTTTKLVPIQFDAQGHITGVGNVVTSLPASDVASWAKASSKPSYNFSEINNTPTTIAAYGITDAYAKNEVYTKSEIDGMVSGILHYKGSVATVADLQNITSPATGDVWHVNADGSEWAWNGSQWQEMGGGIDLSNYVLTTDSRLSDARTPTAHTHTWNQITANKPTTLAGYGITDARISSGTITLGNNSITPLTTKPSYTASEVGAVATADIGTANGVAPLDSSGKVPYTYLPNTDNNIIEGYYYNNGFYSDSAHTIDILESSETIYIDIATDKLYRYAYPNFIMISGGGGTGGSTIQKIEWIENT